MLVHSKKPLFLILVASSIHNHLDHIHILRFFREDMMSLQQKLILCILDPQSLSYATIQEL